MEFNPRVLRNSRILAIGVPLALSIVGFTPNAAAGVITIQGNETFGPTNCIPFGCPATYGPFMGFVYKNIPAFALAPGDTLAFDTGATNDVPLNLNIALSATTANGGDTPVGYAQVVTAGTPAAPTGDNVVGNYDLAFTIDAGFSFGGGGLIVRFQAAGGSLTDFTSDQVLMGSNSLDTSGYFVGRFFSDADGVPPYSGSDSVHIGNFRIVTDVEPVPEPTTVLLVGSGFLGLLARRRRN